jgi:nucleoside-diphosphate-sugar epimerase
MKILVYGHSGWIFSQFKPLLFNHIIINGKSRCNNYKETFNEIRDINPDRILCCIGRAWGILDDKFYNTDYLELEGHLDLNLRDNFIGPLNLFRISNEMNIHCTYIGTGCIYNYNLEKNEYTNGFSETDEYNFLGCQYNIVKAQIDKIAQTYNNVLNLRVRLPLATGEHFRNFLTKLISYKNIQSFPNSYTCVDELFPIAIDMLEKKICGTFNFVNSGVITNKEILELYKKYINPEHNWVNVSKEDMGNLLLSKRCDCKLDISKLLKLYPYILDIRSSIIKYLFKD